MPQSVSDVMTRDPVSMSHTATIREASEVMRDRDIGDVVVTDAQGQVCGIVTDRDIVVGAVADGRDPSGTSLEEVCRHRLVTLASTDSAARAIEVMSDEAIRRLPVVDDGQLVGFVSLGDLAEERDQESLLGQISAAPPNN